MVSVPYDPLGNADVQNHKCLACRTTPADPAVAQMMKSAKHQVKEGNNRLCCCTGEYCVKTPTCGGACMTKVIISPAHKGVTKWVDYHRCEACCGGRRAVTPPRSKKNPSTGAPQQEGDAVV